MFSIRYEGIICDYNYMNLEEMSNKHSISLNTMYRIIKRENIQKRGYKCNQKKD